MQPTIAHPGHDLSAHLQAVSQLARRFAEAWGAGEAAELAGLWHDLGKYKPEFQDYIHAIADGEPLEGRKIDHSAAGALLAVQRFGDLGRLIAYVIAGHHSGLPDWDALHRRLVERAPEHLERTLSAPPPAELLDRPEPSGIPPSDADIGLWVRMLASAVLDADFLDTEQALNPEKAAGRGGWPELAELQPRLDGHLRTFDKAEPTPVNRLRAEVLAACRSRGAACEWPGLFSLTVPTGGGKTLASLAFALAHAQARRERPVSRIIYAAPFTAIIDQTADVFIDALGREAVLEHHSALAEDDDTPRGRLAAENWDAPVIVTTTVQLFESLFGNRVSRIRKLHNLANSVLILDEAQALPHQVLIPVTRVLDELWRHYGVTVVLCTATQPRLGILFKGFEPVEIAADPGRLFDGLDRIKPVLPRAGETMSWQAVAERMAAEQQALTIVNRRDDCRTLHALLPEGSYHLSTWQTAEDRLRLLGEIGRKLKDGEEVRVVATSMIEAGVDLDFPTVFRALAGLDQLAQAAGRCNRHGTRPDKGRFVVFRPEGAKLAGHMGQAAATAEGVIARYPNPFRPDAFAEFFDQLYWTKGIKALDAYDMRRLLRLGRPDGDGDMLAFDFSTAAERFVMVEERDTRVVVPRAPQAAKAVAALSTHGPDRDLLRTLQRHTVAVPPGRMNQLRSGAPDPITEPVPGLLVLSDLDRYDSRIGMQW